MSAEKHAQMAAPGNTRPDGRIEIVGLSREELQGELVKLGQPRFRAGQVWHWVYFRGETDFQRMSTLSKELRGVLTERFAVTRPAITRAQRSLDGTQKWLLKMPDGQEVECVHIPEEDRGALCVSSQVGCTLTCRFCHTGTQRLVRNLAAAEIVGQVMHARDQLKEWPSPKDGRMLSNIVMMGMGEPLYNYDNVSKALRIVMDAEGIAISRRRITLSTAGVAPMIRKCGQELGVRLAVSLHAVNDEIRDRIVPLNRKYPIEELLRACREYPGAKNARRITFEYIMLRDVNDSVADARELVRLIRGIPAKVNLIPFNAWPGAPFECSSDEAIAKFAAIVNDAGYASPVRTPRGRDILAACGQLKSDSVKQKRTATAKAAA